MLALVAPRVGHAGCPGGGGGGGAGGAGGAGGGGGGGGTDVYSLPPLDAYVVPPAGGEPPCVDTSDVVGYRRCSSFGAWAINPDLPPITVVGGVIVRRFASLLDGQIGNVTHGTESFVYRAVAQRTGRSLDTAVLSTLRGDVSLPHGLYGALEVDLGGLTTAGAATTEMMSTGALGTPQLSQDGGFVVDSLAVVGLHGSSRAGALGVELAGGVRAISYSFDSQYVACEQATSVTAVAPIAEARLRGELWFGPWLTAGVTVGTSVIEQHAWMGGLYLGVHARAYGGQ
ncbi:MAG TPA: hypothetical protein VH165_27945 [Kofleriaceae bacterium]|nr:hypothetical protein [Kofleriaceae bacterium]